MVLQYVKLLFYFAAIFASGKGKNWEQKERCLKMGCYGQPLKFFIKSVKFP